MKFKTIDQIIDANMTVTDHLLRDAIHAVAVDLIHETVMETVTAILPMITNTVEQDKIRERFGL